MQGGLLMEIIEEMEENENLFYSSAFFLADKK